MKVVVTETELARLVLDFLDKKGYDVREVDFKWSYKRGVEATAELSED